MSLRRLGFYEFKNLTERFLAVIVGETSREVIHQLFNLKIMRRDRSSGCAAQAERNT